MKDLKKLFATTLLSFVLASSALADGHMDTGFAGHMDTGCVSTTSDSTSTDLATELTLYLVSVLATF